MPVLLAILGIWYTVIATGALRGLRSEGENLDDPAARLACLEVFAMGGATTDDDASESGYFAVRAALARAVSEAAKYVAQRSVVEDGAPVIVRLLAQISARFNTVVGEKILAQGVPIVGAFGGATINVLRLERSYGKDEVRKKYDRILAG